MKGEKGLKGEKVMKGNASVQGDHYCTKLWLIKSC